MFPSKQSPEYSDYPIVLRFLLACGGLALYKAIHVGGRCHPFGRSWSQLEEADDAGTPSTVTDVSFELWLPLMESLCHPLLKVEPDEAKMDDIKLPHSREQDCKLRKKLLLVSI